MRGLPKYLFATGKSPFSNTFFKSCSHPNTVTVIQLTLIAFLHPHSHVLHQPLSFYHTQHTLFYPLYVESCAGLKLITCGQAPGTVFSTENGITDSKQEVTALYILLKQKQKYGGNHVKIHRRGRAMKKPIHC